MTAMIKGAKGGSKKQRTPREAPDSLVSIAYARLIDLVSEGEIEGLVDGERSIYLDETPADQFSGFTWEQRTGTQDQDYLQGFPQVENEIGIGTELRSDLPWVRSITNSDLSAVRITISLPRLTRQDAKTGDTNGYRIDYAIDVAEGMGAFQEVLKSAFDGKSAGGYERSIRIDLPGRPAGGWRIRVRRLTANSQSSLISDTTTIKSITEIIDAKFRYPNSALVGMSFDAETFGGSIPKRGFHARGRIIRVPSNYDHATRTYTGVWDGTFKLSYSNNPAWVYYDLLLHPRYGLGDRVDASQVDKWALYQIAQYCDQLVPDGMGGMEPRFTCNLYLQKRADAYKVLQDIAAIFRGITYWGAGQAVVSADMPADPVYTYTNANVIGGKFNYKGSKRSTRYSAALVSWNDPADMYRAKVEYVQDDEAVARFGVQTTEIMALGCTSQGQAQRAGKWALLTNLLETETVTFSVGLDGIRARPGQIIRVADNDRAGRRIGGRVSSATRSAITVDKAEGVEVGDELTCILPSGSAQTRTVTAVDGNQITVSPQFDAAPVAHSVWAWESQTLAAQRYRIASISESGPLEYAITASKYVEGKHQAVDNGAIISQRPITSIPSSVQAAPENIRAISSAMIEQTMAVTTMTIMWDAAEGATRYDVEWRRGDGQWVYAGRTGGTELDVVGIYAGTYQIRVRALNSLDVASPWGYSESIELDGKQGTPPAPAYLDATGIVFGIHLRWGFPAGAEDTLRTEIQYNTSPTDQDVMHLGDYAYPIDNHTLTGLKAGQVFHFRARLVDRTGNIGPWSDWVMGQSSADADEILDYLAGQISETELGQHLQEEIGKISGDGPGSVNERIDAVSGEFGNISGEIDDLNVAIGNLNDQVAGLDSDLQDSVSSLNQQIANLETQLADITGAEEWVPGQAYLAGSLVRFDGALYRAEQGVPAGTPVSNTAYWRKIGDYASLGEAVAALAIQVTDMQLTVDEISGEQAANVERLNILTAQARGRRADGEKADALRGWETQASITERDRVEASDKEALAQRLLVIDAQIGDASAQLSTLQQAFASESEATAGRLDQLAVELGTTTADLQQEIQTRVSETMALARDIQAIQVQLAGVATSAALQALTAEVEQLGEDITAVSLSVTSLTGRIEDTETGMQAMSDAVEALTTDVAVIDGKVTAAAEQASRLSAELRPVRADGDKADSLRGWRSQASITESRRATATEAEASAERDLLLQAGLDAANAALLVEQQARATADSALAEQATSLRARIDSAEVTIGQVDAASVSRDEALGQRASTIEARMPAGSGQLATSASVQAVDQASVNRDNALASRTSTVEARMPAGSGQLATSAAVQTVSQAVADLEDDVSTMWSVRMQVNNNGDYVYAGIGLGIENGPGGLQSQFLIEANRFALLNTLNGVTTTPFVVEGGQVFMNSAVIKQADIVNLIVTGVLQSSNYVAGQSGIRLNFVTGEFEMNGSVPGQGRMTITNRATKVYDGNGVLRVQLGDLGA